MYLGQDIPKLGFGMMRLPHLEDGSADIEQVCRMMDAFIEAGLTYVDTARFYGDSEEVVRKCLVERYPRDAYQLATKNACWGGAKSQQEARDMFQTSIDTLGVDYVDYYLIHNVGDDRTEAFDKWDMWNFILDLKAQGKVKHVGFSFHDNADVLREQLTKHPEMEFVQLQVNYADWDDAAVQSRLCMEVAREFDKPVIIMEPIKGGVLANPTQTVADILASEGSSDSPAQWALRFAWGQPHIITVLSGMSTLEQMEQNIKSYQAFEPLSDAEHKIIKRAQEAIAKECLIPCTNCHYCVKECPVDMPIPGIMQAINRASAYSHESGQFGYNFATRNNIKASDCIECASCETACPQHIQIVSELKKAVELFEG